MISFDARMRYIAILLRDWNLAESIPYAGSYFVNAMIKGTVSLASTMELAYNSFGLPERTGMLQESQQGMRQLTAWLKRLYEQGLEGFVMPEFDIQMEADKRLRTIARNQEPEW